MKTSIITLLALMLFSNCTKRNYENDIDNIKKIMEEQSHCWSNGDIDGFMKGYWESDSLRFLGRKGLTYGWQTTLNNYKKSYPNPAAMGKLRFDYISFEPLDNNKMFVVGKWSLFREKDTLSGYYSLIWKEIDNNWKVIFDHTN